jgi:hypothetical protein
MSSLLKSRNEENNKQKLLRKENEKWEFFSFFFSSGLFEGVMTSMIMIMTLIKEEDKVLSWIK